MSESAIGAGPSLAGSKKILKTRPPKFTVRCPKCRALPGRQCLTSGGNRTSTAHVQRKQAQHRQDYLVRTALMRWESVKQQARG